MEAIFRLMHRTPRNLLLLAVSVMLSVSALGRPAENREVERLLFNGKVFTAEPNRPYAEAVGIRGTRIVAVGRRDEVAAALGTEAEPLDLQGRMLLPGFIDVHNHVQAMNIEGWGREWPFVRCGAVATWPPGGRCALVSPYPLVSGDIAAYGSAKRRPTQLGGKPVDVPPVGRVSDEPYARGVKIGRRDIH